MLHNKKNFIEKAIESNKNCSKDQMAKDGRAKLV